MNFLKNVTVKPYSYYKTGGSCDTLYMPESLSDLMNSIKKIKEQGNKYYCLGCGANSLISDSHWSGDVILFNNLNKVELKNNMLIAQAGVTSDQLTEKALENYVQGLEWMHKLPGNVGGIVYMNARCFGGEVSKSVKSVQVVTEDGIVKKYEASDVFLGYKQTIFMNNKELIYEATFNVSKGDHDSILARMQSCKNDREGWGHFLYPSCGCVFKNNYDVGISSGFLLDELGAKSLKLGGAEVSSYQANFIYNKNNAKSDDILMLSFKMQELVYNELGIWLEYEMRLLGEYSEKLTQRFLEKRPNQFKSDKIKDLKRKFDNKKGNKDEKCC